MEAAFKQWKETAGGCSLLPLQAVALKSTQPRVAFAGEDRARSALGRDPLGLGLLCCRRPWQKREIFAM